MGRFTTGDESARLRLQYWYRGTALQVWKKERWKEGEKVGWHAPIDSPDEKQVSPRKTQLIPQNSNIYSYPRQQRLRSPSRKSVLKIPWVPPTKSRSKDHPFTSRYRIIFTTTTALHQFYLLDPRFEPPDSRLWIKLSITLEGTTRFSEINSI